MGKGRNPEKVVREIAPDAAAVFGRREDPHHPGGPAGGGQHRGALPARRVGAESLLPLEQGVSGGGEEAAARRHHAAGDGPEVKPPREENQRLKQVLAETVLENRWLKKSVTAADSEDDSCA